MTLDIYIIAMLFLFFGFQFTRPFRSPLYHKIESIVFTIRFMIPIYGIIMTYIYLEQFFR